MKSEHFQLQNNYFLIATTTHMNKKNYSVQHHDKLVGKCFMNILNEAQLMMRVVGNIYSLQFKT